MDSQNEDFQDANTFVIQDTSDTDSHIEDLMKLLGLSPCNASKTSQDSVISNTPHSKEKINRDTHNIEVQNDIQITRQVWMDTTKQEKDITSYV